MLRTSDDPGLAAPLVEELLRFEPPVQMLPQRTAPADIDIAGTTIPKGASLYLMVAAGNPDPQRFPDPDRFLPDRPHNEHLGFGHGIHSCFGAPSPAWRPNWPWPPWPTASTTPA